MILDYLCVVKAVILLLIWAIPAKLQCTLSDWPPSVLTETFSGNICKVMVHSMKTSPIPYANSSDLIRMWSGRVLELVSVSWFISFLITLFFFLLPGSYNLINDREEVF